MIVGIIGSGGREHAICSNIKKSRKVKKVFCIPGYAGTAAIAENVEIKIASGMVADLYAMPEVQKKEPPKEENKGKSGFSLFSRKK